MKLSRRTALLTAAGAAVASPALAQKSADTLRIQFVDAVPNVDMYFNSQRTGLILAHQAWDMLVHRDPATFEIKPSLATDWRFAEDNSLDLTIRQGVKFHDGSTLGPDGALATQLPALLQQVSEAARSIRELADFLDRHPEALLRGRHEAPP